MSQRHNYRYSNNRRIAGRGTAAPTHWEQSANVVSYLRHASNLAVTNTLASIDYLETIHALLPAEPMPLVMLLKRAGRVADMINYVPFATDIIGKLELIDVDRAALAPKYDVNAGTLQEIIQTCHKLGGDGLSARALALSNTWFPDRPPLASLNRRRTRMVARPAAPR